MNSSIFLCSPHESSFNHDIASAVSEGLSQSGMAVRMHDLYAERFDPILSETEILRKFSFDPLVQTYMEDLIWADLLVVVHPDWWGQPPAMLKGWIDRVLRPGIAYEFEGEESAPKRHVPLFSGKKAKVYCTTDASPEEDSGTLKQIWCKVVWPYCGIPDAQLRMCYRSRTLGVVERGAWARQCKEDARIF